MTRRAYLYFVLIFVLGILVGAGGLFFYALETNNWHPPYSRERAVKAMTRELKLSPSQVSQVREILENSGKQRRAVEERTNQQFDALREQTRNSIRGTLNPEQLSKFNEIVRQHDEQRRRMRRP
jgi:hypothetical protein